MGGLAGIVYPKSSRVLHLAHKMLDAQAHRMPKGYQVYHCGQVEMGGSVQPWMERREALQDTDIWVFFDGGISNAHDLQSSLVPDEYARIPQTEADLIACGYREWGEEVFARLQGAFTIAIFDKRNQKIVLARDRIGEKPLYWTHGSNHFIFASELKAILSTGIIPQALSHEAIAAYLHFGFIPQDMTPIKGVNKLLPGYYLRFTPEEGVCVLPYWSYSSYFIKSNAYKDEELFGQFQGLLKGAINKPLKAIQHRSDTVISILEGAAAPLLACEINESTNKNRAVTLSTDLFPPYDEKFKESFPELFQLENITSSISPETFNAQLPKLLWHLDEPLASGKLLQLWQCCSEAALLGSPVVVSSFGVERVYFKRGYDLAQESFFQGKKLSTLDRPFAAKWLLQILQKVNLSLALKYLRRLNFDPLQKEYLDSRALFDKKELQRISPLLAQFFSIDVFVKKFYKASDLHGFTSVLHYLDAKTVLPDSDLLQFDRISSAFGVKSSSPFASQQLMEFFAAVPMNRLFKELGKHLGRDPLLQRFSTMRSYRNTLFRPCNYLQLWDHDPLIQKILSLLPRGMLVENGLISSQWLSKEIAYPHKTPTTYKRLWALLTLELWYRLFVHHPVQTHPPEGTVIQMLVTQ